MRKIPGWRTAVAACAVAGFAVTGLATSASAATMTGHDGGFQPQVFIIHTEGVSAPSGTVKGFGPIRGQGTDTVVSDSRDLFAFDRGSVYVNHKAKTDSQPKLDLKACTATIYETGTWQLDPPGTGKYDKARGWGKYAATIVLGFRVRHHGPDAASWDRHHRCRIDLGNPKIQPKTATVDVFAWGQSSLGKHHRG
jgi:hypothetical protein